jgi:hypothetical protein
MESSATEDIRVSLARARLLEWRRREPQLALAVVEAAQRRMPHEAEGLELRKARLRRKVTKRLSSRQRAGTSFGTQLEVVTDT